MSSSSPVTTAVGTCVPYTMTRIGGLMAPDLNDPAEVEGVLNPASGWGPDGKLYLLPRMVAAGNVSRVGLAEVKIVNGLPVGVQRRGIVLAPEAGWEGSPRHSGVEDPRVTYIADLGLYLMSYIAYGPLGPKPALAVSEDLQQWKRLGPLHFEFQEELNIDLNLVPNKDVVFFSEPVPGPDGEPSFAVLHRPMWDLDWIVPGSGLHLPAGILDDRPGIWMSYLPVRAALENLSALVHLRHHRLVALPEYDFEVLKIGAGPPPIRIPEGWLLIHHGVTGHLTPGTDQQQHVRYCAGAMILAADDPSRVIARTSAPLLEPVAGDETTGIVPNVVFPSAIERIQGRTFVFYGMADSKIGVAALDRIEGS